MSHIFEAYRIDRLIIDDNCLNISDTFPFRERKLIDFESQKKRNIESVFENVRNDEFSEMPSRLNTLFVFPEGKEYENYWCNAKFRNHSGQKIKYVLYKLNLDGDIVWLDSEYFDECSYPGTRNIEDSARCYWKSKDDDGIIKKDSVEGLFKGKAIVSGIQIKTFPDQ